MVVGLAHPSKTSEGALAFCCNGLSASLVPIHIVSSFLQSKVKVSRTEAHSLKSISDMRKSEFGGPAGARNRVS